MASYRNISMDFWTDSKVVDDFTPEDRYIYLYCMTNPHTNLFGCYEVSIKQIANETGYNNDSVERLLKRLDEELALSEVGNGFAFTLPIKDIAGIKPEQIEHLRKTLEQGSP